MSMSQIGLSSISSNQNLSALHLLQEVEQDQQNLTRMQKTNAEYMQKSKKTLKNLDITVQEYEKQQKVTQAQFLRLESMVTKLSATAKQVQDFSSTTKNIGNQTTLRKTHAVIYLSQLQARSKLSKQKAKEISMSKSVLSFEKEMNEMWLEFDGFMDSLDSIEQSIEEEEEERLDLHKKIRELEAQNSLLKTEKAELLKENRELVKEKAEKQELIDNVRKSVSSMKNLRNDLRGIMAGA